MSSSLKLTSNKGERGDQIKSSTTIPPSTASISNTSTSFEQHQKYIGNYLYYHGTPEQKQRYDQYKGYRSEYQILKDHHQFIRDDDEDDNDDANNNDNWERQLAKKYYDQLFKEYAIIDLSQYKSGQIGLRWRVESEVISGKGQFICANRKCTSKESLKSYEVPFTYIESKIEKSALVKVALCYPCSKLLHYTNIKKKKKELKRLLKKREKNQEQEGDEEYYTNDTANQQNIKKQKITRNKDHEDNEEEYVERIIPAPSSPSSSTKSTTSSTTTSKDSS